MDKLTPRQQEIARLLASGLSQKEIAHKLGIRVSTCYDHTRAMRQRTGHTTTGIAVKVAMTR